MATTWYAWSNFPRGVDEKGNIIKPIAVGSEITRDDLGVDADEWKTLINSGSIRKQPYPNLEGYGDSPNRYFKDQLVRASEGDLSAEELAELQDAGVLKSDEPADVVEEKTL